MAQAAGSSRELWDQSGFQYLSNHMVSKSWSDVRVILLVRRTPARDDMSLQELINAVSRDGDEIFILVDPYCNLKTKVRRDSDIQNSFRVFIQTLHPPWNLVDFKFHLWLSRLMIPLVILTGTKFKWNDVSFNLLFLHSPWSHVAAMLSIFWREIRNHILDDLSDIMENPSLLFCSSCNDLCRFKQREFHIDFSKFQELIFSDNLTSTGIFTRSRLFGCMNPIGTGLIFELWNKFKETESFSPEKVNEMISLIDLKCPADEKEYCCYLLWIFQGPSLEEEGEKSVTEMLADDNIKKLAYAGVTKGTGFRREHLYDKCSAVNRSLSRGARMFVIRRFICNSKMMAHRNESIIIDLLKSIIAKAVDEKRDPKFLLLNKNSGTNQLLGVNSDQVKANMNFVEANIQIVDPVSLVEDATSDPAFIGNYGFTNEVNLGHFDNRNYDDVKHYIQKVEIRCRNACWSDL